MEKSTITYADRDFSIYHHGKQCYVSNGLIETKKFYEDDVLWYCEKQIPGPHGIILDVGAHIGNHTLFFSNFLKSDHIIAFEPCSNNFKLLQLNAPENVLCLPIALSDKPGWNTIEFNPANSGGLWLIPFGNKLKQCYTTTLDQWGFDNISLIKVDVENSLPAFLNGATETIIRCRPHLVIEQWPEQQEFVINYCISHNYTYTPINNNHIHAIPT